MQYCRFAPHSSRRSLFSRLSHLDQVDVESLLLDGLDRRLRLLNPVQVRQHRHGLASLHRRGRGLMQERGLVQGQAVVEVDAAKIKAGRDA